MRKLDPSSTKSAIIVLIYTRDSSDLSILHIMYSMYQIIHLCIILYIFIFFQARQKCMDLQKKRREHVKEYLEIQKEMETIVKEIMKTERGTDRYVELAIKENDIIKRKNDIKPYLEMMEEEEKLAFDYYNSKVSESHEKERLRTENFKLYYLCWSIAAVALGLLTNFIYNRHKNKEFRDIVLSSTGNSEDYKRMTTQLINIVQEQQKEIRQFFSDVTGSQKDLGNLQEEVKTAVKSKEIDNMAEVLKVIKEDQESLLRELREVKKVVAVQAAKAHSDHVVYVGPEVRDLLSETESNIQRTVKIGYALTMSSVFCVVGLTVPIVLKLFKGD